MFPPICGLQNYLTLLDDEDHTLESLKIQDDQHLVIEGTSWICLFFLFQINENSYLTEMVLSQMNLVVIIKDWAKVIWQENLFDFLSQSGTKTWAGLRRCPSSPTVARWIDTKVSWNFNTKTIKKITLPSPDRHMIGLLMNSPTIVHKILWETLYSDSTHAFMGNERAVFESWVLFFSQKHIWL